LVFSEITALGFTGMKYASYLTVPLVIATFAYTTLRLIAIHGGIGDLFRIVPKNPTPLPIAFTIAIGTFIAGATLASDINRFAKTVRQSTLVSLISFGLTIPAVMVVGAITALITGNPDLISALASFGLLSVAALALILSNLTTSNVALYLAAVPLSNLKGTTVRRAALGAGTVGSLLAAGSAWHSIQAWLLFLGIVLPPLAGPIIVEGFTSRKFQASVGYHWRWKGFIAWGSGILAGILSAWSPVSFLKVASVNGIVVSILIYGVWTWLERGLKAPHGATRSMTV
jgi:cytosine permease